MKRRENRIQNLQIIRRKKWNGDEYNESKGWQARLGHGT